MARLATVPCTACGAELKRSVQATWSTCRECSALRDRFLARELAGVDPDGWVRGRNAVCGSRRVTAAVVAYEQSQAA